MPCLPQPDKKRGLFASPGHFAVALALSAFGILSLWNHQRYVVPIVVILGTDLYIGAMLWKAACVSQGVLNADKMFPKYIPYRTTALVMLLMLAIALISAFAGLYIETNSVHSSTLPTEDLRNPIDAIYFSVVTITTLGYGDFLPYGTLARMIVVGELASGVLLLIGAFPLLISRMGNLD
jgi:ABC-type glucose/galactose transport system permease subunit